MAVSEEQVREALKPIEDPELHVGIVDLGLIYGVDISPQQDGEAVKLTMTFTSPACPYGPQLKAMVEHTLAKVPGVKQSSVQVVFTPPWDPRTMATEDTKVVLGIGGWDEEETGPGGEIESQR